MYPHLGSQIQQEEGGAMLSHLRHLCEKAVSPLRNEKGQGLVEYALILVLIAIVVIAAVKGVGSSTNSVFSTINSGIVTK
jgi:pilus assembly protein Flp/PilA